MENLLSIVNEESVMAQDLTLEQRVMRCDTLLCVLFGGFIRHPLANNLLPPEELTELRQLLGIETGQPPGT
jgi:hypothetical protein